MKKLKEDKEKQRQGVETRNKMLEKTRNWERTRRMKKAGGKQRVKQLLNVIGQSKEKGKLEQKC